MGLVGYDGAQFGSQGISYSLVYNGTGRSSYEERPMPNTYAGLLPVDLS